MDIPKIKNAQEAKQLSDKKQMSLEQALEAVTNCAVNGQCFTTIFYPVSNEVREQLLKLGFKLSYVDGQFKEVITKIEW